MNSSKADAAALDALFGRISPGGIIVLNDYGWARYPAQRVAADEFMQKEGYRVLEIPTGQGLMIKR